MKCSLCISNFLEEISSLSHSVVFLYFFALIAEEGFLISLASLWNSAFRCLYLSFSPLLFACLFFTAICKASPDSHFAFLHLDHFKVFTEFSTILFLFYVLVFWPRGTWDYISLTRDRTGTLCIGRPSLNHWATREVPQLSFKSFYIKQTKQRPPSGLHSYLDPV